MYIVYKIINTINEKIYVGVHKTDDILDSYMGTGKLILKAHKKYGIKNFKKEILFVFDSDNEFENEQKAFLKESEIVNQEFVDRPDTYNLDLGGRGGIGRSLKIREQISKSIKGRPGKKPSLESRLKMSQSHKGKTLSKEHKEKIGLSGKGRIMPKDAREKIKKSLTGKPRSEIAKNSMREGYLKTPSKLCPYCGIECKPAPFKRWHGDNCKKKGC